MSKNVLICYGVVFIRSYSYSRPLEGNSIADVAPGEKKRVWQPGFNP